MRSGPTLRRETWSDDPVLVQLEGVHQLGARANAHLVVDVLHVVANRVDADAQCK